MLDMWFFTVCSEMARVWATSLFVLPWAMVSRIWTSRTDSGAKTSREAGPYTDSSRNSARTREATEGRLVDEELARVDAPDGLDQLGGLAVLPQVGRRAGAYGVEERLLLFVRRE